MEHERGTQPMTRSVSEVVDAIRIVESELEFQINRLEKKEGGRTMDETDHLADLAKGYETARRYLKILRRYQEGRIERLQQTGSLAPVEDIDDTALRSVRAVVDDGDSPA